MGPGCAVCFGRSVARRRHGRAPRPPPGRKKTGCCEKETPTHFLARRPALFSDCLVAAARPPLPPPDHIQPTSGVGAGRSGGAPGGRGGCEGGAGAAARPPPPPSFLRRLGPEEAPSDPPPDLDANAATRWPRGGADWRAWCRGQAQRQQQASEAGGGERSNNGGAAGDGDGAAAAASAVCRPMLRANGTAAAIAATRVKKRVVLDGVAQGWQRWDRARDRGASSFSRFGGFRGVFVADACVGGRDVDVLVRLDVTRLCVWSVPFPRERPRANNTPLHTV